MEWDQILLREIIVYATITNCPSWFCTNSPPHPLSRTQWPLRALYLYVSTICDEVPNQPQLLNSLYKKGKCLPKKLFRPAIFL